MRQHVNQLEIPSASAAGGDPDGGAPKDDGGVLFGRYRLLRRIGKGGMAEAFLAIQEGPRGFRRKCVVKRIRPDKAASTYFTQMFVDEARITAALHHPNIVQVYEFGEVGDLYFLSMEFLDGRNLGALLDGLHNRSLLMPINMAAHIARQVARALHYAHNLTDDAGVPLGVIHRDVSPTNVMLLRTGEVKLLDFGVAKAERALKQGATVVGKVKGKLSYMSPEQHAGKLVDLRADVFSLGVMLWEMVTGQPLFSGESGGERSRKMMRGQVAAPSTLRSKVTPALDEIILRCLKVQPDDRYPSAGVLADALGAFVRPSLFDPAELSALITDYPGDEEREPSSVSAPSAPLAPVESHAILTREEARGESTDDMLMAATTARERLRPVLLPAAGPVAEPARAPTPPPVQVTPPPVQATPPPVTLTVPEAPSWRRFWAVAVVVAAAVGLAVALSPRPSAGPSVTVSAPRRARAEITPVPSPAPAPETAPLEAPAAPPELRSDAPAPRAKVPAPGRHRGRADGRGNAADPDLKLVDPF